MIELTDKDFLVKNNSLIVKHKDFKDNQGIIMFKTEWCGHCQRAKPEFSNAADILGKSFPIATIDCDENKYAPRMAGVSGYPTIKFIDRNGKISGDYEGDREVGPILQVICDKAKVCKRI